MNCSAYVSPFRLRLCPQNRPSCILPSLALRVSYHTSSDGPSFATSARASLCLSERSQSCKRHRSSSLRTYISFLKIERHRYFCYISEARTWVFPKACTAGPRHTYRLLKQSGQNHPRKKGQTRPFGTRARTHSARTTSSKPGTLGKYARTTRDM